MTRAEPQTAVVPAEEAFQSTATFAPSPWEDGRAVAPRRRRDPLRRRMLALADAGAAFLTSSSLALAGSGVEHAAWAMVFAPAWILLAKLHGLYDRDHRMLRHLTVDELPSIFLWAISSVAATSVLLVLTPAGAFDAPTAAWACLMAAASSFLLRSLARVLWRRITPLQRTVILGEGSLARAARRKAQLFPDMHLDVVGEMPDVAVGDLERSLRAFGPLDRVILASASTDEQSVAAVLAHCRARGIKVSMVPSLRGMFGTAVHLDHVAELPVVEYSTWDVSRSTMLLKHVLDIGVSAVTLAALAPLAALVALAIKLEDGGPVIFSQLRAGLKGRPFRIYKFRTMVTDAEERLGELIALDKLDEPVFKLRGDPRVTRVGRFLRRTSLDELPQLVNVLRGEMSLVGPRPEQLELVRRYLPEHRFRLTVKPGVTGPMQVYGRGDLTWEERLAVEREYTETLSIGRDLRILAMTAATIARGGGAY